MQTTAIRTVANSLPQNEVILLTLLISKRYIPNTDLQKKAGTANIFRSSHTIFNAFLSLKLIFLTIKNLSKLPIKKSPMQPHEGFHK